MPIICNRKLILPHSKVCHCRFVLCRQCWISL